MAKIAGALVGIALVVAVAATFTPTSPDEKKLEEIRALLADSNRMQRIDLHRRTYREHRLFPSCDFERKCEDFENRARRHNQDSGPAIGAIPELWVSGLVPPTYFHPFTGECGGYGESDDCKKVEEAYRQKNQEEIQRRMKIYQRKK